MILNSLNIMKPEPFSDEVDSTRRRKDNVTNPPHQTPSTDGASIEIGRRPRGRPPGSKNKPKPPVVITKDAEPTATMRPYVLEITAGNDIVDSLARFSRRRKVGICVLAAMGTVANVTIRQPGSENAMALHGRFEILSISAAFMPPLMSFSPGATRMTISLAGPQGQVIGGTVAGPLVVAGAVMVVAAAFENATVHRLPLEEEVTVSGNDVAGEEGTQRQYEEEEQQRFFHDFHIQQTHSSQSPAQPVASAAETGGLGMYGTQFSQEMIWPPGGRQTHGSY